MIFVTDLLRLQSLSVCVYAVAPAIPVMPLDETIFLFVFDSAIFMNRVNSAIRSASLPAQLYILRVAK